MVAMKTIFGWTVGGGCNPSSMESQSASTCINVSPSHENVEELLKRFWHLEEPPCGDKPFTADEREALTHFKDTVRRQPDGRYEVSLPSRSPLPELGKSQDMALKRYMTNERSLTKIDQWEIFTREFRNI